MTPSEQRDFIRNYLVPELKRASVAVGILVLDHNYDQFNDINTILDDDVVRASVRGTAYHCYSGDYTQMSLNHHPELPMFQTECASMLDDEPQDLFKEWMEGYVLGPITLGSVGAMAWNLCLDQTGGVHDHGCYGCAGLMTTDFSEAEPTLNYSPEYYALAHFSRFLRNSERVELEGGDADLQAVAFANADGAMSAMLWNGSDIVKTIRLQVDACNSFEYDVPPQSATTFVWDNETPTM